MPLGKGYLTSPAWDVLIFKKECCGMLVKLDYCLVIQSLRDILMLLL